MPEPRRHHYVPQFHLRWFADANGKLWIWDKVEDRVFQSTPDSIAIESDFYRLHEFEKYGHDPYAMEKQLAHMEGQASLITGEWLDWLRKFHPGQKISIPKVHRYIVARFMAVQFLRTADTRDIINTLAEPVASSTAFSKTAQTNLHAQLIWDQRTVRTIAHHIRDSVWIFARNATSTPFITSDNPIAFRTKDNRMWLKIGFVSEGTYAVYPLAPDIVMFCHERKFWDKLRRVDRSLSPVALSDPMVESENSGQVFMARRFVVSPVNEFTYARNFAKTIGTDVYAAPEFRGR